MSGPSSRTITVGALTRVEGEGALHIDIADGQVAAVQLAIFEPPRFFEALLRGRPLEDTPDITARICGICPIAYQMTAVHALEQALGVTISPEIRQLRRLLYCGEWIESHGVHMHLLHIPDFFGCASAIQLAQKYPTEVQRGLRLKQIGNRLLEVMGGRAVHPINVAVGGFYRAPDKSQLRALSDDFRWGLEAAIAATKWVSRFDFPDFTRDYDMVSLQHPHEYPMNEGEIVSNRGLRIQPEEFETHFDERQVPHSTALQAVQLPQETVYKVGPLARINLNRQLLSTSARQLSDDVGIAWPCFNPYQSIVARAIEVVHAFEEGLALIEGYEGCRPARISYNYRAGEGAWATEAPRGLIFHRYRIADDGLLLSAKIVPPTSQNQAQIEADLAAYLPSILSQDERQMGLACERLIRCYDPCISCSTHFLKLKVRHR